MLAERLRDGACVKGMPLDAHFLTTHYQLLHPFEFVRVADGESKDGILEEGCPVVALLTDRKSVVNGFATRREDEVTLLSGRVVAVASCDVALTVASGWDFFADYRLGDEAKLGSITTLSDASGRVWVVPLAFAEEYVDGWVSYDGGALGGQEWACAK